MDDAITELDTPEHPERTAKNKNCGPRPTVTCRVDSERSTKESVDQKDVYGDQNTGESFVLTRDSSDRIEQTCGVQKSEPSSINSGDRDIETTQSRKRGDKPKHQVTGSWALRSKSREKPKALEPDETAKEGNTNVGKKRKERKKKRTRKSVDNEFSRKRAHLRYLLHRIKYEQNLIDAYSAEGWKGQSLEKLKPEKELQRAKSHILLYKSKIRALFRQLDQSLSIGKLPEHLFNSKGEIDSEDIFCAKCNSKDLTLDNDIILCDGGCERGFHQYCLEPPLLKEQIPPGNEAWLCPGCDCKVYCIDMLKDFQETKLCLSDSWEKIFPEATEASSGKKMDDGLESFSGDSEDEEYDPDKPDGSSYFSASDGLAAFINDEKYQGFPYDDSEDDDFDPSAPDSDNQAEANSSSSDFTSDSEDPGGLHDNAATPGEYPKSASKPSDNPFARELGEENFTVGTTKKQSSKDELSYLIQTSGEAVTGKRRVERLDYRKLNDETFANLSSDSSDEDFEEGTTRKRRMCKHEKTEATSPSKTSETNINSKDRNMKQNTPSLTNARENAFDGGISRDNVGSGSKSTKRSHKRLGETAKQRLCQVFNENQYPEKSACENLAEELGLTAQRVRKWFENARWSFRDRPRMDSIPNTNDENNGT